MKKISSIFLLLLVSCANHQGKGLRKNFVVPNIQTVGTENYLNGNSDYIFTPSEISKQWYDNSNSQDGIGDIQTVNDMPVSNNETITISKDYVNVRGVINQEAYEFESIILLKNGEPFAKFDALSNELVTTWEFTFLTGYVDGCEEITVNGLTGDTNVGIGKSVIICK